MANKCLLVGCQSEWGMGKFDVIHKNLELMKTTLSPLSIIYFVWLLFSFAEFELVNKVETR